MLVAGSVGQEQPERYRNYRRQQQPAQIREAGTESAGRERIGDFYLYPLPERTTIANQQTKQVSFLDARGTPTTRGYEYRNAWLHTADRAESANSVLHFSSSRQQGLGDALPAGTVRVYQRDARGNPQFVGESPIPHTPMGSQIGLTTGQAFDVKVRPIVVRRERITTDQWLTTQRFRIFGPGGIRASGEVDELRETVFWQTRMRYTFTNARPEPVVVALYQSGLDSPYSDTRIVEENLVAERLSAEQVVWHVTVPANGSFDLDVVFQSRH